MVRQAQTLECRGHAGLGPVQLVGDGVLLAAGVFAPLAAQHPQPGKCVADLPVRAVGPMLLTASIVAGACEVHATPPQKRLADLAIRGERFVGVESGGYVVVGPATTRQSDV